MEACLFWFQIPCSWIITLNCFHTNIHRSIYWTYTLKQTFHWQVYIRNFLTLHTPFISFHCIYFSDERIFLNHWIFFSPHKVWGKQEVSSKDQREETPVLVWLGPVLPYLFYNDCRAKEAPAIAYPWATKIDNLLWEFMEIVTHQPSLSGRSHWNFNVNNTHFSL